MCAEILLKKSPHGDGRAEVHVRERGEGRGGDIPGLQSSYLTGPLPARIDSHALYHAEVAGPRMGSPTNGGPKAEMPMPWTTVRIRSCFLDTRTWASNNSLL